MREELTNAKVYAFSMLPLGALRTAVTRAKPKAAPKVFARGTDSIGTMQLIMEVNQTNL